MNKGYMFVFDNSACTIRIFPIWTKYNHYERYDKFDNRRQSIVATLPRLRPSGKLDGQKLNILLNPLWAGFIRPDSADHNQPPPIVAPASKHHSALGRPFKSRSQFPFISEMIIAMQRLATAICRLPDGNLWNLKQNSSLIFARTRGTWSQIVSRRHC